MPVCVRGLRTYTLGSSPTVLPPSLSTVVLGGIEVEHPTATRPRNEVKKPKKAPVMETNLLFPCAGDRLGVHLGNKKGNKGGGRLRPIMIVSTNRGRLVALLGVKKGTSPSFPPLDTLASVP